MPPPLDLIFVHIPKTGGTAIRQALAAQLGDQLLQDYGDSPGDPSSYMNLDPEGFLRLGHLEKLQGRRAVFGHFWPNKYKDAQARLRATVLREPVERLISLYHFWRATSLPHNAVWRLFRERQLTLLEFARLPAMRGNLSAYFFRDVDMRQFDYVGDHADLERDWDLVTARLGLSLPRTIANRTGDVAPDYARQAAEALANASLVGQLRAALADDIRFYERWTSNR